MQDQTLSIYERIILESIYQDEKTFSQLNEELGFKQHILQSALNSLVLKDMVQLVRGNYICKLNSFEFRSRINSPESLKVEINYLQRMALEQTIDHDKNFLKLRKVYLNAQEKAMLKAMFTNIESFLSSTKKTGLLKDQNLVYWCNMPMTNIVNSL